MSCVVVTLTTLGPSSVRHFRTPQEAVEETFKEDIVTETLRRQRIERIQMKKRALKAKKTTRVGKVADVAWHVRAQDLPLALFHTTVGPIIGRVERVDDSGDGTFNLRLWAPAALRMAFEPGQPGITSLNSKHMVTFQPMALVETYLDLSSATPFGRSPVPDALVPSYDQYFQKFVLGEYSFTRVVAHVEQAAPHGAPVKPPEDSSQDCPTMVRHWEGPGNSTSALVDGPAPPGSDAVDSATANDDKADDESSLS